MDHDPLQQGTPVTVVALEGEDVYKRQALGLELLRLKRDKVAALSIGTLRAGQYRALTAKEIDYLYSL